MRRARVLLAGVLALAAGLAAVGCGGGGSADDADRVGIDRATFIETYIDLRGVARNARTAGDFDRRKREVLERHGVTEEELLQFVERPSDVHAHASMWDEIEDRLSTPPSPPGDSVAAPDSSPAPGGRPGR